jgi:hypothetical protein
MAFASIRARDHHHADDVTLRIRAQGDTEGSSLGCAIADQIGGFDAAFTGIEREAMRTIGVNEKSVFLDGRTDRAIGSREWEGNARPCGVDAFGIAAAASVRFPADREDQASRAGFKDADVGAGGPVHISLEDSLGAWSSGIRHTDGDEEHQLVLVGVGEDVSREDDSARCRPERLLGGPALGQMEVELRVHPRFERAVPVEVPAGVDVE